MKVNIHRTRDHIHVTGRAQTNNINEAIALVYNRKLRPKGTRLEYVASRTYIGERLYEVRMGWWEPAANASALGDRIVVSVEP